MSDPRDPSPAITRGLRILEVLESAAGNPQTLSDIARAVGIAKSSASNLCAALEKERMIQRVESGYRLGMRTAELGGAFALQFNQVREFFTLVEADPELSEHVVQIATRLEADAVYLARHEGRRYRLGTPLGSRLPLVYCAVGTAMLLKEPDEQIAPLLRKDALRPPTAQSSRDAAEISARIRRAREAGYAVDRGESFEGVHGVAAPLEPWRPGDPPMAIGVALPADEADEATIERIGAAVLRVTQRLTNPLARRPQTTD
ncbi:IclR family transcriptional regulator [Brachybacterium sacelli]|uniref:DNA-binding IclR family transcriptional regulator n=1 Tax=Brachybacterium sacelli TaxID=173364 RepID=A0ABS4X3M9_9MICO|nr:IclR family transcriptional regulator [Brachybacterium sacelli]MBP2383068.1 DNA-binding IclR family transcriptional regulator [Brachybacterium sacelli]